MASKKGEKELSNTEILILLKHYFKEDIFVKAMTEVMDDVQLQNWVKINLPEIMCIKNG